MNLLDQYIYGYTTEATYAIRIFDKGKYKYLQNRNLSKKRWWTEDMGEAMLFYSRKAAENMMLKYKFNSPTVVKL